MVELKRRLSDVVEETWRKILSPSRDFPGAWPVESSYWRYRETSLYQPFQSTHLQPHLSLIILFGIPLETCHDEARRRSNASVVLVHHPQLPASISRLPLPLQRTTEFQLINTLCSIVISVFAIVILSVIGSLFKSNHHSMMGSTDDPKDGPAVAATVFSAVIVYVVRFFQSHLNGLPVASIYSRLSPSIPTQAHSFIVIVEDELTKPPPQVFLVGCGFQAFLHYRDNRRGAITLS
jgi:ribonuclease kappa